MFLIVSLFRKTCLEAFSTSEQVSHQDIESGLNLVQPGTVFGHVDEANARAGIGEHTCRLLMLARGRFCEFSPRSSWSHTVPPPSVPALRIEGVELIGDKNPASLWVPLDCLAKHPRNAGDNSL
jgi:hypothetical protein